MSTGPGRPSRASRKASRSIAGTWSGIVKHQAALQTGAAMRAMSTAWKASLPSWEVTFCPVMAIRGIESTWAVYRPVTRFVAAGPDVQMARARRPLAR